jgi:hypothetical protein
METPKMPRTVKVENEQWVAIPEIASMTGRDPYTVWGIAKRFMLPIRKVKVPNAQNKSFWQNCIPLKDFEGLMAEIAAVKRLQRGQAPKAGTIPYRIFTRKATGDTVVTVEDAGRYAGRTGSLIRRAAKDAGLILFEERVPMNDDGTRIFPQKCLLEKDLPKLWHALNKLRKHGDRTPVRAPERIEVPLEAAPHRPRPILSKPSTRPPVEAIVAAPVPEVPAPSIAHALHRKYAVSAPPPPRLVTPQGPSFEAAVRAVFAPMVAELNRLGISEFTFKNGEVTCTRTERAKFSV